MTKSLDLGPGFVVYCLFVFTVPLSKAIVNRSGPSLNRGIAQLRHKADGGKSINQTNYKKTVGNTAYPVITQLTKSLLTLIEDKSSSDDYAFLYLHSQATAVPVFDNANVKQLLSSDYKMLPPLTNNAVWPFDENSTRLRSNFVVSGIDERFTPQLSIEGHAEHRVFRELPGMLGEFKGTYGKCPSCVVFGSGTTPCEDLSLKKPSCAIETVHRFAWLVGAQGGNCPCTKFVLGYNIMRPYLAERWGEVVKYLTLKGIIVVGGSGARLPANRK